MKNFICIFTVCALFAAPGFSLGGKQTNSKPAEAAIAVNADEIANSDAVLIAIRGLKFIEFGRGLEIKHIKNALTYVNGLSPAVQDALGSKQYEAAIQTEMPYEYPKEPLYIPDNYLTSFLAQRLPETGKKYALVDFVWDRDADGTASAYKNMQQWLERVCALAAAHKKPVYIVAHSWGTVLAHATLSALDKKKSPAHVKMLITMGSPLVPKPTWMKAALKIGLKFSGIDSRVKKPGNVEYWVNLWAEKDIISNQIGAADKNIMVDASAIPCREALAQKIARYKRDVEIHKKREQTYGYALLTMEQLECDRPTLPEELKQARADLSAFNSVSVWHGAYFTGVEIKSTALGKDYRLDAVQKFFMPLLR